MPPGWALRLKNKQDRAREGLQTAVCLGQGPGTLELRPDHLVFLKVVTGAQCWESPAEEASLLGGVEVLAPDPGPRLLPGWAPPILAALYLLEMEGGPPRSLL